MVTEDMDWFVFGTERLAKLKYTPEGGWNFNGQAANTLSTKESGDPFEKDLDNRGAFVFQADFYLYDHLGNSRVTYRAEVKSCKEDK